MAAESSRKLMLDPSSEWDAATDSDDEKSVRSPQHQKNRFNLASAHAITSHRGVKVAVDRSFDARGSFVHFVHHSMRDVLPGHELMDGHTARNLWRSPGRSSWYDSEHAAALRMVLRSRPFQVCSMISIIIALFFSDLFLVCQVPTNIELDVLLTCAFLFFSVELVALAAAEANYPLSFFFLMDLVGTVSMVFDISFMFGPDASMPERLAHGSGNGNVVLARAARTARLGARAGRLSRVAKILRFLNDGDLEGEGSEVKMSKIISSKLSDVLSIRVAFLTICVSLVLPSMRMFEYPDMDESMVAWTQMVAMDLQGARDVQAAGSTTAAAIATAQQRVDRGLRRFAHFYRQAAYGPFLACFGQHLPDGRFLEPLCGGPPAEQIPLDTDFGRPRRGSSILEMSKDGLHVFFDMSSPQRWEAAMSIGLVVFVIVVMIVVSSVLSASIAIIALTPLERMLFLVRERCTQIFKYTNMFDHMQADDTEKAGEGDQEEKAYTSEFVLLEKAVSKLAAIVHLSAVKREPEMMHGEALNESDIMVMNWMQGPQVPTAEGRRSSLASFSGDSPLRTRRGNTMRFSDIQEASNEDNFSLVLRKVPQEICQAVLSVTFDALEVPKDIKHLVAAYIIYYADGNSDYTSVVTQEKTIVTFASRAEQNYLDNPFHNFSHGLDVAYAMSLACHQIDVDGFLSEDVQLWVLVAALGHDLGHLGVNNQFLIESSQELAVMYNDRSPLENMHCSKLFAILSDPDANVFQNVGRDEYKVLRKSVIDAILHTDIIKHNEMVKELNLLYQMHSEVFDDSLASSESAADILRANAQLVVNCLLHCADVGNPMKPWDLCYKWAYLCLDEFFAQGDREKELGIPVQMLNDRDKVNRPNSQLGFIEYMLAPYAEALISVFPGMAPLAEQLGSNLRMWVKKWEEEARPPEEIIEKVRFRTSKTSARLDLLGRRRRKPGQPGGEAENITTPRHSVQVRTPPSSRSFH